MKLLLTFLLSFMTTVHATEFHIVFKNGHADSYDSSNEVFKRNMCEVADKTVDIKLNYQEIQSLKSLAEKLDFYNEAEDQADIKTSDNNPKITVSCSPCAQYYLEITTPNQTNKVTWDCGCDASKDFTPKSIKPLVLKLKNILYQNKKIKNLNPTDCRYI